MGCNGGDMAVAMQYIESKGSMSEADYPYLAYDDTCKYDASKVVATL